MIEWILICSLSVCILLLVYANTQLTKKIRNYEFERFMQNINKELTSRTVEDHTIVERTLQ